MLGQPGPSARAVLPGPLLRIALGGLGHPREAAAMARTCRAWHAAVAATLATCWKPRWTVLVLCRPLSLFELAFGFRAVRWVIPSMMADNELPRSWADRPSFLVQRYIMLPIPSPGVENAQPPSPFFWGCFR